MSMFSGLFDSVVEVVMVGKFGYLVVAINMHTHDLSDGFPKTSKVSPAKSLPKTVSETAKTDKVVQARFRLFYSFFISLVF